MARKKKLDERLKALVERQKSIPHRKRKMGNTSNVWSKADLQKSTIVIG